MLPNYGVHEEGACYESTIFTETSRQHKYRWYCEEYGRVGEYREYSWRNKVDTLGGGKEAKSPKSTQWKIGKRLCQKIKNGGKTKKAERKSKSVHSLSSVIQGATK